MNVDELIAVGFNRNEAAVYLALVELGQATARELIQRTKFHKNIVYDNLTKLADKGLVSQVVFEGATLFSLASPTALTDYAMKELEKSQSIAAKASSLQSQINKVQSQLQPRVSTELFVGAQALRSFFEQTFDGGDYCVIGAPQASVQIMGAAFWQNYNRKMIERKTTARMLFNESLRTFADSIRNEYSIVRFLPVVSEPLTEIFMNSSCVAIMVWTREPSITLIRDEAAARGYREYFELLWKIGKE